MCSSDLNTIKGICDEVATAGSGAGLWLVLLPNTLLDKTQLQSSANECLGRFVRESGATQATVAIANRMVTVASSAKDDRKGDRYADGLLVIEAATEAVARYVASELPARVMMPLGLTPQFIEQPAVLRLIHELP